MATKDEVWAAADMLVARGERPTLAAVRRAAGGGSYTTISGAMVEWRTARRDRLSEAVPEIVVAKAGDLAAIIWAQAQSDAAAKVAAKLAEAAEMADALAAELERTKAVLVERDATIENQRLKCAGLQGQIDALQRVLGQIRLPASGIADHAVSDGVGHAIASASAPNPSAANAGISQGQEENSTPPGITQGQVVRREIDLVTPDAPGASAPAPAASGGNSDESLRKAPLQPATYRKIIREDVDLNDESTW